jgi:ABC-type multidrug transport system fused ATPase/permease subunit
MAFSDHFVGVPQSRWAGYAILVAIVAVALSILFGKEHISIGKRVMIIVIMFLFALPTIAIVLFQLTCLVNGTSKAPFCGWYAWIVAVLTIIYCILLIIVAITVKSSDKHAEEAEKFSMSFQDANVMAKKLMNGGAFEMFEDMPEKKEEVEEAEEGEAEGEAAGEAVANDVNGEKAMEKFVAHAMANVAKKSKITGYAESEEVPAMKGQAEKKEEAEKFTDYGFGAATIVGTKPNMYML